MFDIRPEVARARSWRRLSVLAVVTVSAIVACSGGDDGSDVTAAPTEPTDTAAPVLTAAPSEPADTEAPVVTDAPAADTADEADPAGAAETAAAPDFGSGTGSITLGEETFELAIGPGTGLCRDVFGIIQAAGTVTDGRDIEGGFMIPPLDWETYDDGRYDPPSVELEITSTGDDNARWRADAGWAVESGMEGRSQVDSYEKDGLTASGTATFANAWDAADESVEGTFEISCES